MDHKGWFTVIQSGLILESFLLPEVCICACGYMCDACVWIHVRLCGCVCVCVVQLPECRLACSSLLCWCFANGSSPVLCIRVLLTGLLFSLHPSPFIFYLEHFLVSKGAHIFCSWCQLCLPLFCQRAPWRYSKDLLNCVFNE